MVIDSSALVAIVFGEAEAQHFAEAILADGMRLVAVPTLLETSIVVRSKLRTKGAEEFRHVLGELELEPVPFDLDHFEAADDAWRQYGKGRHKAALNFGDCIAYALAKVSGEPLLYKGTDFALTDIPAAI